MDIRLVQDTVTFARVICGKNLIDRVKVTRKDSLITLYEYSDMNWTRSYRRSLIELHFKEINFITLNNCVNLKSLNTVKSRTLKIWDNSDVSEMDIYIRSDHFSLVVSEKSSGIFQVTGETGSSYLRPGGSTHFRLEAMLTDSCHVEHTGIGDCYVNVKRILEGKIAGKGRVLYTSYPSLTVNISNLKGKLIPLTN
jgi:hypothetical protein